MPLVQLNITSVWGAFTVSSFVSAFIVVMAVYVKDSYDNFSLKKHQENNQEHTSTIHQSATVKGLLITFAITFVAYFLSYVILYILFGYTN